MVAAKEKATGADDNDFDSFVEPASLILSTVIKFMPASYPDRARLLEKAENMKLPGNPLVGLLTRAATDNTACCYAIVYASAQLYGSMSASCLWRSFNITAAADVLQWLYQMQKARMDLLLDLTCVQNLHSVNWCTCSDIISRFMIAAQAMQMQMLSLCCVSEMHWLTIVVISTTTTTTTIIIITTTITSITMMITTITIMITTSSTNVNRIN